VTGASLSATTLPELFEQRLIASPGGEAYREFDQALGRWTTYSWTDVAKRVTRWRRALRGESLEPGARIGILLPGGIDHVCADQAALSLGLVPVPLHVVDNPDSLGYVLADSGASLLLLDSAERWQALEHIAVHLPNLHRVVHRNSTGAASGGIARGLTEWLDGAPESPGADTSTAVTADALAAIVYTSGTTGRPKGVMLSHRNIIADIRSILEAIPVLETDVFLSFLPLSHTFERTVGYYLAVAAGATVAFARSVSQLMEDLAVICPTVLVSVPRIYERAYAGVMESLKHKPARRALFELAVRVGWRRFGACGGNMTLTAPRGILSAALDRWVGTPVRARFGGRLRAAVTGGAPMPLYVARPFLALGVPLLQGYGMTESAPVVACNTPEDNDPQSVGRPLPGIEVGLGENDELLVRGPNVMPGYWQRPDDTARALDVEGWLHTGDQAAIIQERIFIKGRIKDILVTSTGEKIAPADLEAAILSDPAFEQAMVIGEGRPYISALVVVNRPHWDAEAGRLGLAAEEPASLRSTEARNWALRRIGQAVRGVPDYARPRAVFLSAEPWTVDSGLITPTLKPKRPAVEARFAADIAELYRGHASAGS